MWGGVERGDGGLSINIQPSQKPKKLTELTYQTLRTFQSEFRLYHLEAKGQATLHGHVTEKMVTVIDSLLGAHPKYQYLLGHGTTNVADLSERRRSEYGCIPQGRKTGTDCSKHSKCCDQRAAL
jgi:hypothetical protein